MDKSIVFTIFIIICSPLLFSCEKGNLAGLYSKPNENDATKCFDIVHTSNAPAVVLQTILINKCTGETWITLREELPKREDQITPDSSYSWYKINRSEIENDIAGINKFR